MAKYRICTTSDSSRTTACINEGWIVEKTGEGSRVDNIKVRVVSPDSHAGKEMTVHADNLKSVKEQKEK